MLLSDMSADVTDFLKLSRIANVCAVTAPSFSGQMS